MTFEKIHHILKGNTTIKLITADNTPLIISFLFTAFKQNQDSGISGAIIERDLITLLTDYLYVINSEEVLYPKPPKNYLTDWTNAGFLRKYPGNGDDFLFDLTPAAENAFKWIDSLEKPEFVGTDSRLKNLFEKSKEL